MSNIQAGLLAAVPLSALGFVYMLFRGKALIALVSSNSGEAGMSDQQWFYLMLGSMAFAPFVLGVLAGFVYGWVGSPFVYRLVTLGLGILLSILAIISRTPMALDKIAMNLMVALDFGLLVPLLSGE